ncbi:hypothetical protein PLICRDRAFT_36833 [Plicaturopsis crispa FD-325 SS-3]|nr:hypothetical protein PLICRDRAFT_36833 [Plicaturopsis crispa FD-325 SS-3]
MPEVIACHGFRGKSGNAATKATYMTNSTTLQNVVQNGRRLSVSFSRYTTDESVVPTLSRGVKMITRLSFK